MWLAKGNSGYQLLQHIGAVATGPAGEFSQPHLLESSEFSFSSSVLSLPCSLSFFANIHVCRLLPEKWMVL